MERQEMILQNIMELQQQQQEIALQILELLQPQQQDEGNFGLVESAINSTTAETVPNEVRTTRTTSSRVSELPKAEKTPQTMEKSQSVQEAYREAEKIARHLYDLKNNFIMLERSRSLLRLQYDKDLENIPQLDARAEMMEDKIENIEKMRANVAELKIQREGLHFWERKRKRELDKEIERAESDVHIAEHYFNSKYHIPLREAPFEIKRLRKEARFKQEELERKTAKIAEIGKELDAIDLEYRAQWQLAENRVDIGLIENLLAQMKVQQKSARDNLKQVQAERNFDDKMKGKNT